MWPTVSAQSALVERRSLPPHSSWGPLLPCPSAEGSKAHTPSVTPSCPSDCTVLTGYQGGFGCRNRRRFCLCGLRLPGKARPTPGKGGSRGAGDTRGSSGQRPLEFACGRTRADQRWPVRGAVQSRRVGVQSRRVGSGWAGDSPAGLRSSSSSKRKRRRSTRAWEGADALGPWGPCPRARVQHQGSIQTDGRRDRSNQAPVAAPTTAPPNGRPPGAPAVWPERAPPSVGPRRRGVHHLRSHLPLLLLALHLEQQLKSLWP